MDNVKTDAERLQNKAVTSDGLVDGKGSSAVSNPALFLSLASVLSGRLCIYEGKHPVPQSVFYRRCPKAAVSPCGRSPTGFVPCIFGRFEDILRSPWPGRRTGRSPRAGDGYGVGQRFTEQRLPVVSIAPVAVEGCLGNHLCRQVVVGNRRNFAVVGVVCQAA